MILPAPPEVLAAARRLRGVIQRTPCSYSAPLSARSGSESLPFYKSVELQQLRQRIVDLVDSLPTQERKVIRHHYFQEVAFDEIAQSMQLTRARISQIHRKALTRLKDTIRARQDCDVLW